MVSVTLFFDDAVSEECIRAWVTALIEKRLVTAGEVHTIKIKRNHFMSKQDISDYYNGYLQFKERIKIMESQINGG